MRVAVTGSTGLVGTALLESLAADGIHAARLVRRRPGGAGEIGWDPGAGRIDGDALEGMDAVVHLAGASIAAGRWNAARKRLIRESRVQGTRLLSETLAGLNRKPRVFLSASAVGYYGDRREEPVDETAGAGEGFLAEVCAAWEEAAGPARDAGVRVVHPRIGFVLSGRGGGLPKMLLPFRLGLGGRIGNGRQRVSWISLTDLVGILRFLIRRDDIPGPVNAVSPRSVTNAELTRALGRALGRPTPFPVPAAMIGLLFGEMGRATLLSGARVLPERLERAGFRWRHSDIDSALRAALEE
ncbi:MAG: TIGR01777 family oxidoreductase [Candidatus Eisenbacteria bacterium]|nr:TIGR01777 family oxidoreductase [Candidatus Eisenbacteria bacterium]